jgi:heme exporter protein C
MLTGMLVMALAFWMYSIAVSLWRVRVLILERERHADWAREAAGLPTRAGAPTGAQGATA